LVLKHRFKRNPKFGETNNIDFSDEGIHFKTSSIDSKLKWDIYDGLLEDEELFVLPYGGQMYTVIPKRCFTEPEMTVTFRNLVRSKVQEAQKRWLGGSILGPRSRAYRHRLAFITDSRRCTPARVPEREHYHRATVR